MPNRTVLLTCLLLGVATAPSCSSSDNTKVVVAVWSDLSVPTTIDSVRLDVVGMHRSFSRTFTLSTIKADSPLVQSDLSPADVGRKDGVFTVTASGLLGATEVVRQRARVNFTVGEARLLTMFLDASCKNKVCPEDSTCSDGACQPVVVLSLPPYTPASLQPRDAADARGASSPPLDSGPGIDAPGASGGSVGVEVGAGAGGAGGFFGDVKPGSGGTIGTGGARSDGADVPAPGAGGVGGSTDAGIDAPMSGGGGTTALGGASGGRSGSGGIVASGGTGGGGSPTGGAGGGGGIVAVDGAAGSVDTGSVAICTPACASGQDCVGSVCMPWFGQTCAIATDCPTGSTCCGGDNTSCAWTRVPSGDGTNAGEFLVSTDYATVADSITGLTWERSTNIAHTGCTGYQQVSCTWAQAKAYCEALELGGYSDWRLPSDFELLTIVDFTRKNPAIDPTAFGSVAGWSYWTGTAGVDLATMRIVDFQVGNISSFGSAETYSVRCVR